MAIAPGQRPDGKGTGLKSGTGSGRAWSGTASDSDPTAEPGQYPPGNWGSALFGGTLPSGTGAPGSQGARGGADPTTEPGQLNEGLSGLGPADTADTGAPGMGTTPNSSGGSSSIRFTDPGTMPGLHPGQRHRLRLRRPADPRHLGQRAAGRVREVADRLGPGAARRPGRQAVARARFESLG
jgi:hypothetical protein